MANTKSPSIPKQLRGVTLARRPNGMPSQDDFAIVETSYSGLDADEILVRNEWFSIDASIRLRMQPTPSPYLAPYNISDNFDGWAIGRVVESKSPGFAVGDYVFHYLGWRDYARISTAQTGWGAPRLVQVDATTTPNFYLGALGVSGLTSWAGLLHVAQIREGDIVYISAAAGAVGVMAVQIAKLLGHTVIGSTGSAEKVRYVTEELGADAAFDYHDESIADGLARLAPDGIDLYFDTVGGDHLDAALDAMRPDGRIALCGAISDYNSTDDEKYGVKHLFKATERGLTLRGFLARMYADKWDDFHRDASRWLASGMVYPETVVDGLDAAPQALIGLLRGSNIGKVLVRM
jgi:NADPH-dependent curcumin reductase CurA